MKKIVTLCTLLALWTGAMAESLSSVSYYDPALEGDNKMTTTPDGVEVTVLDGRTLYKDGHWNTLCLPFDLTLAGSVLDGDGVQLMTFDNASLNDGTLSLDFSQANAIQSGVPYLIKWNNTGQHLANPVFQGVILDAADPADKAVQIDGVIRFEGC